MYNEHVHFKLFERIPNSHVGRMWRYLGLIDNKYDLVVSGEADDKISKYFDIMNSLCRLDYTLYVLKYKSHWFNTSILAGNIYVKPKLFSSEFREDWFRFLNALYTIHNKVPGWQDEIVSTFMLQKLNEYAKKDLSILVELITNIGHGKFWKDINSLSEEVDYLKTRMDNINLLFSLNVNYIDEFPCKIDLENLNQYK